MISFLFALLIAFFAWMGGNLPAHAAFDLPNQSQTQVSDSASLTLEELRAKAFAATNIGDFSTAEHYWTELLKQLPEEPAIWSNRGNARVSQNKLEEAIADYDRAIALAPDAPDPYLNRGTALEGLGRWDAAIADYNRVLELDPQDPAAFNNRGNAEAGLGQWEQAIADYRKAADMAPEFAFARANYALALYQVGQVPEAVRTMKNLVRKYPQFADMRAALTAALWVSGNRGEAESNWVAAVGLDRRYKDLDWVAHTRRWTPAMVTALEKFLKLQ
ncbi:MAG: tetratricopeptide repeat protein [Oscillatoriophycideae cyanobacterium NC_groundwater_1537_Pr4_S-0.65um_50_18]|nr:tetratricopeptide repeat protein [Oscillatoriophycideae cyanobacterium NC_groundwater_1537_Pr4_S-0.65um_50_18]